MRRVVTSGIGVLSLLVARTAEKGAEPEARVKAVDSAPAPRAQGPTPAAVQ
jgi:hypothetical protein